MPRTSTIPPELKEFLKRLKTSVLDLHCKTKIPRVRLVEIYEKGDATDPELIALLAVLGPPLADYLAAAIGQQQANEEVAELQIQIGQNNQGGSRNRQYNGGSYHNHNNRHLHLHLHLTIVNEPEPKALVSPPQQWEAQPVQPGGQIRQIGQPVQPSGQVRQLGQPLAVLELERAA